MRAYLARRVVQALVVLVLVSLGGFTVLHLAPGGPGAIYAMSPTMSAWTTRRARYARIAGPRYGPVREVTSAITRRGRGAPATGVDGARSHQVARPSAVTRERH